MATTLRIEHLVKRFEGLVAVNDLSIDVQEREIPALIGPNGSGKTTLSFRLRQARSGSAIRC